MQLGIPRSITVILLERRTDDLAAARRKAERQDVVLHRELPGLGLPGRHEIGTHRGNLLLTAGRQGNGIPRGESRRIGFNDRLCGSQRILVGLPFGHLLLVFLLFFRIEVGEAHEEQGNYDNTNDRFFIHLTMFRLFCLQNDYFFRSACSSAAFTKATNSGEGLSTVLLYSGWYCVPMNHG